VHELSKEKYSKSGIFLRIFYTFNGAIALGYVAVLPYSGEPFIKASEFLSTIYKDM